MKFLLIATVFLTSVFFVLRYYTLPWNEPTDDDKTYFL